VFYVSDIIAGLVQYGHRTELCQGLQGGGDVVDLLHRLKAVGDKLGVTDPTGYDLDTLRSYIWYTHLSSRQWYWQLCT